MNSLKVAAIQLCSGLNTAENLTEAERQFITLQDDNVDMVVLPESFALSGGTGQALQLQANKVMDWMVSTAKNYGCWLIGGTLPIPDPDDGRSHATCLVYGPDGQEVTRYHKIHLFDAEVSDRIGRYRESRDFIPGRVPELVDIGTAKIGLSVCYDLRFPELYRYLTDQGATLLTVPSAFTTVTGAAHWEVLLRARAIENQCFVVAANQAGTHPDGRQTYGHSMIISPWGDILAEAPAEGASVIMAELDLAELARIRQKMPCLEHRRLTGC